MKYFAFSLLLLLMPVTLSAQSIDLNIHKKSVIKEDKSNFLIGRLAGIQTDSNLNIYLFDTIQKSVIKLDKTGKFQEEIVRSGRGPGEVSSIYSYFLNKDSGEILIADRENMRLNVLDLKGNEIRTIPMHPNKMNVPLEIKAYSRNKYLMLFSLSPGQSLRRIEDIDSFFHLFDINSGKRLYSFGERTAILDSLRLGNGIAAKQTTFKIGSVLIQDENRLIYAPYVYNGKFLQFRKDPNQRWSIKKIYKGENLQRPASIELDFEDYRENRRKYKNEYARNIFSSVGSMGNAAGLINYRSANLSEISNDYILHMYVAEYESEYEDSFYHVLMGELFDRNMNYLLTRKLMRGKEGEIFYKVDDKDKEGNYYLTVSHLKNPISDYVIQFSIEIDF